MRLLLSLVYWLIALLRQFDVVIEIPHGIVSRRAIYCKSEWELGVDDWPWLELSIIPSLEANVHFESSMAFTILLAEKWFLYSIVSSFRACIMVMK